MIYNVSDLGIDTVLADVCGLTKRSRENDINNKTRGRLRPRVLLFMSFSRDLLVRPQTSNSTVSIPIIT